MCPDPQPPEAAAHIQFVGFDPRQVGFHVWMQFRNSLLTASVETDDAARGLRGSRRGAPDVRQHYPDGRVLIWRLLSANRR